MRIEVDGVGKVFKSRLGPVVALGGVDLSIDRGEFVCFVGPSGCGKSTLCNMLAGFDTPTEGRITLDGETIKGPSIERAMMFQEPALFPWLNARDNVAFGLNSLPELKNKAQEKRAIADRFLKMVHLAQFGGAQPHELSGGMRQRVALARALAVDPKVFLMDEPFAALDAQTRDHLHIELQTIWRETRKTIVFVTHNVREAVTLATRIVVFTARPGTIKAEFNLEELEFPRSGAASGVNETIARVQTALRDEVAKVEAREYDQPGAQILWSEAAPDGIDRAHEIAS